MKKPRKTTAGEAEKKYPGAAVDTADSDKVTGKLVKERVEVENNNPRNNDR